MSEAAERAVRRMPEIVAEDRARAKAARERREQEAKRKAPAA